MDILQVKRVGKSLAVYIPKIVELPAKIYYERDSSIQICTNNYLEVLEYGWQEIKDPDSKKRFYFKLKSNSEMLIGAERRLPLNNLYNCRDLGGYHSLDGRLTRWGLVFRSDALHQIDTEGQNYIEKLGIKRIIDFRSPEEIAKDPNKEIKESQSLNFNPHADVAQQASTQTVSRKDEDKIAQLEQMVKTESGREQLQKNRNVMIKQMEQLVLGENAINAYRQFFETLLQDHTTPLIFHCQGGKDRTGWAAALYLASLGVDKDQIYQDYLLTDKMNAPRNAKRMEIYKKYTDNEDVLAFLASLQQTKKEYLDGAYQAIEEHYGTILNYLTEELGISHTQIKQLKERYLY